MSKLRCWPGCLAIVLKADIPEAVGCIVQVVRASHIEDEPAWWVRIDRPMRAWTGLDVSEVVAAHALISVPDAWMTPITPPPGTETVDTSTPLTEPVPA